jgi:hypothetical protein
VSSKHIWHPLVHQKFGETLHFIFITCGIDSLSVLNMVKTLLDEYHCTGYCLYEVFGYTDILVRVWTTPTKWDQLYKGLDQLEKQNTISVPTVFAVNEVEYLQPTVSESEIVTSVVPRIATDVFCRALKGDEEVIERFQKEQIIVRSFENWRGYIKFFVILAPKSGALPYNFFRLLTEILRDIQENNGRFFSFTIYKADQGQLIIKGLTNDFHQLYELIESIRRGIGIANINSSTSLVAKYPEYENDDPDFERTHERSLVRAWLRCTDEELEKCRRDLSITYFSDVLSREEAQLRNDKTGALRRLLKGFLFNNKALVRQGLSSVSEFEEELSVFLLSKCFPAAYGNKKWIDLYKEEMSKLEEDTSAETIHDPKKMTIAPMLFWIGKLRQHEATKEEIEYVLGDISMGDLDRIRKLRNDFVHGGVVEIMKDAQDTINCFSRMMNFILRLKEVNGVDRTCWR